MTFLQPRFPQITPLENKSLYGSSLQTNRRLTTSWHPFPTYSQSMEERKSRRGP